MQIKRRRRIPVNLAKSSVHPGIAQVLSLMKRRQHLLRDISEVVNIPASSFE